MQSLNNKRIIRIQRPLIYLQNYYMPFSHISDKWILKVAR